MTQVLTSAQANRAMGWTRQKLDAYWDAKAQACRGMADEGTCLAQVARHRPVTLLGLGGYSGLGQTASQCPPVQLDAGAIAALAAGIVSNPDAALRVQGPRIVAALDRHIIQPVVSQGVAAAMPYLLKYMGPPLVVLYGLSIASMIASYQVLKEKRAGKLAANRRRKRRRVTTR